MPKRYTSMRDSFKRKGMTAKGAKKKAARIFNATRPAGTKPVTRKKD